MSLLHPKHFISAAGDTFDWQRISEQEAIFKALDCAIDDGLPLTPVNVYRKHKREAVLVYRCGYPDPATNGRTPNATTPGPLAPVFEEGE